MFTRLSNGFSQTMIPPVPGHVHSIKTTSNQSNLSQIVPLTHCLFAPNSRNISQSEIPNYGIQTQHHPQIAKSEKIQRHNIATFLGYFFTNIPNMVSFAIIPNVSPPRTGPRTSSQSLPCGDAHHFTSSIDQRPSTAATPGRHRGEDHAVHRAEALKLRQRLPPAPEEPGGASRSWDELDVYISQLMLMQSQKNTPHHIMYL